MYRLTDRLQYTFSYNFNFKCSVKRDTVKLYWTVYSFVPKDTVKFKVCFLWAVLNRKWVQMSVRWIRGREKSFAGKLKFEILRKVRKTKCLLNYFYRASCLFPNSFYFLHSGICLAFPAYIWGLGWFLTLFCHKTTRYKVFVSFLESNSGRTVCYTFYTLFS